MISIVVPVYNEDKNILRLFTQIQDNILQDKETLVIYDFDEDSTVPVVKNNLENFSALGIKLVKNNYGSGVVNALKKGLDTSEGDYVLVLMADLSDDLGIVDRMIEKMDAGYDIVCGSRYMRGGSQIGGSFFKKTLSGLAGRSLKFFSRIPTNDVTNNFKMYRKSVLEDINIESKGGFEVAMEITVKAYKKGFKITEIPSRWLDRTEGKSNFKIWKWIPHYLKWYFYCLFAKNK